MRTVRVAPLVLAVVLGLSQHSSAQTLNYLLFERYLEALRQQSAIPGLSAAIVQDQQVVWSAGLGKANVEGNVVPDQHTPYVLGSASQVFASTLLVEKCSDTGVLRISDPVASLVDFPDALSTLANLLTHTLPTGVFHYDLARYTVLTPVIERCTGVPYDKLLATTLLDPLQMSDSVPGQALASPTPEDLLRFDANALERYALTVSRLAVPCRVGTGGNAIRSDFAGQPLTAAAGVIASVEDLVRFDNALNAGTLLSPPAMNATFTPSVVNGAPLPTGLGWFVQYYNGDPRKRVVWQFGMVKDAYSSLILKLPEYKVTLILLANSDGLSSPFALANGDITASPFAKLFFRIFGL